MLLQQIKLLNIRSYHESVINFSPGLTLLSGDIGSGKSTVLLAIEFALFGISRPDLLGEALLRKGCTQGSVELSFGLQENNIVIKRILKKEKEAVKQVSGYIVINEVRKDLTPVELKAEVLSLLGYPEEFITKNKNYIFRYTVYTPQEEMKMILLEDQETRLDVLRKIFNIDKYKNIRENVQNYLKQMRMDMALLNAKLEPLEEKKRQLEELEKNHQTVTINLTEISSQIEKMRIVLREQKNCLGVLEKEQQQFLDFKQQLCLNLALLDDKNKQLQQLMDKQEKIKSDLSRLVIPADTNFEQIKSEIITLEKEKNQLITTQSFIEERLHQLKLKVEERTEEIDGFMGSISQIGEKNEIKQRLLKEVSIKEELNSKMVQLEELGDKTSQAIAKNNTIISQARELQQKIMALDHCPTCLQAVSKGHKDKVFAQEEQTINQAENILFELGKKKLEIVKQKSSLSEKMDQIIRKENYLTGINQELVHLEEKKKELEKKQIQLKYWVQEQERLNQQLIELRVESALERINQNINFGQELVQSFNQKKYLEQNLMELDWQVKNNLEQIDTLNLKIDVIKTQLNNKTDFNEEINEQKKKVEQEEKKEKELSITQAQLQTRFDEINRQRELLSQSLNLLREQKEKLIKLQELHYWLEEHFLKLTYTIEKQVMVNIHGSLNQLFQEWFSILIEDENMYSKIDDSFTPIIEQNGYEIFFHNLSGGERTSAALAYRLALNKVINEVIGGIKTKELLILDEPTDGFSSEQLDKVREVLERLNLKQIIIVSHESKIESFVNEVIRISKEGGSSAAI